MLSPVVSVVLAALLLAPAALAQSPKLFPRACPDGGDLPFAAIAVPHPIDSSCPDLSGLAKASEGSHRQNEVKNNFCAATPQPPATYTPKMLTDLQQTAFTNPVIKAHTGQGKEPTDRTPLRDLHEGDLVRIKGYLVESHYADLGTGESVNCDKPSEEENDIHIALGSAPDTPECESVSAEIIPHFRPKSWTAFGDFETYNAKTRKYTVNPQVASRLQAHPYRITGQLFYDASHTPCACGTSCSPTRASSWEIHPVYSLEVCKSAANCDEANDADWMAFDSWWQSLTPIQKVRAPHKHEAHEPRPKKAHPAATGS